MTKHEIIRLGVLKKCIPLKSFPRHRWWKKRYGDCGPIRGKKKEGKTHLLYYILQG